MPSWYAASRAMARARAKLTWLAAGRLDLPCEINKICPGWQPRVSDSPSGVARRRRWKEAFGEPTSLPATSHPSARLREASD